MADWRQRGLERNRQGSRQGTSYALTTGEEWSGEGKRVGESVSGGWELEFAREEGEKERERGLGKRETGSEKLREKWSG